MRIFEHCRVEDFVDSRNGELAKEAEFGWLLVDDRVADANGFLRDDSNWALPYRYGVLDEARGEEIA